jgi:hypothetical protein
VFCRCEDRSEGTKLCKADGVSFEDCKCDGTQPPITEPDPDGGIGSSPMEMVDSGAPPMGPTIDAKCTGKLALVSGSSADNATYFASYKGGGLFNVTTSASSPGVRGPVTILPAGGALIATYTARLGYLGWTKFSAGSWSPAESLTDGAVDTSRGTSMTLIGGQLRLFYLGQDSHYYMGTYGTSGWDVNFSAGALAEPAAVDGGTEVPGKSSPASAAVGSSVTLAFSGNDGTLARETFASGSWSTITKFPNITAYAAPPAIVALDPGGTDDELMVYAGSDLLMHVATRAASNKVWSAPILFDTAATSSEIALGALPGGKAIVVYKGGNGQGYYAVWSMSTGFSAPTELVPGKNPEIASVPSITRGACGSDATIAFAQKDGNVKIVRYTGTTMSPPFDVGGLTKATFVGVGELP